jgi:hypothetical protein
MIKFIKKLWHTSDRLHVFLSAALGLTITYWASTIKGFTGLFIVVLTWSLIPLLFSALRPVRYSNGRWYNANDIDFTKRTARYPVLTALCLMLLIPADPLFVAMFKNLTTSVLATRLENIEEIIFFYYPALIVHTYFFIKSLPLGLPMGFFKYCPTTHTNARFNHHSNFSTSSSSNTSNTCYYHSPTYSGMAGNIYHKS